MPRTARHAPGGYIYHVLNRGVGRQPLFVSDDDYRALERPLALLGATAGLSSSE